MLYAVVDQSGDLIARDLTASEAAHEILTVDGQEYAILRGRNWSATADPFWTLWTRHQVANKPWTETSLSGYGRDGFPDAAYSEIFSKVVSHANGGRWWKAKAVPQAEYDEMQARLEAEAGQ